MQQVFCSVGLLYSSTSVVAQEDYCIAVWLLWQYVYDIAVGLLHHSRLTVEQ